MIISDNLSGILWIIEEFYEKACYCCGIAYDDWPLQKIILTCVFEINFETLWFHNPRSQITFTKRFLSHYHGIFILTSLYKRNAHYPTFRDFISACHKNNVFAWWFVCYPNKIIIQPHFFERLIYERPNIHLSTLLLL